MASFSTIRRAQLKRITLIFICGLAILGEAVVPKSCLGKESTATPHGPTLSNPAQLSAPGYLKGKWDGKV